MNGTGGGVVCSGAEVSSTALLASIDWQQALVIFLPYSAYGSLRGEAYKIFISIQFKKKIQILIHNLYFYGQKFAF